MRGRISGRHPSGGRAALMAGMVALLLGAGAPLSLAEEPVAGIDAAPDAAAATAPTTTLAETPPADPAPEAEPELESAPGPSDEGEAEPADDPAAETPAEPEPLPVAQPDSDVPATPVESQGQEASQTAPIGQPAEAADGTSADADDQSTVEGEGCLSSSDGEPAAPQVEGTVSSEGAAMGTASPESDPSLDPGPDFDSDPDLAPDPGPEPSPEPDPDSGLEPDPGLDPEPEPSPDPEPAPVLTGWQEIDGARYYYGPDGEPLTGEQLIDGAWYYLDPDAGGAMATGLVRQPVTEGSGSFKTAYYDVSGQRVCGQVELDGATYYFSASTGALTTGFVRLPAESESASSAGAGALGPVVFFDTQTAELMLGEAAIHGGWRYFDPDEGGAMSTGFTDLPASGGQEAKLVYYDTFDGAMYHGEQWIEGDRYWFDPVTGASSEAQRLRWMVNHASGGSGVSFFNGGSASQGSIGALTSAMGSFASLGYSVGFLMMDLNTGMGVASNVDADYYSASTVKGPYVASVYDKAFGSSTAAAAAWQRVLSDTCVWSSNEDYLYLRGTFGSGIFADWLYEAGVDPSHASTSYTWYSPRELGKMWLSMYDYFGSAGAAGQQMSSLFSHGYYSSIYYELGDRYAVRSKPGWYPQAWPYTATNDAGIVYAGDDPYLVVVLSNAPERLDLVRSMVRALDAVHADMVS